jgi:RNA polymerase-binding transcription factor DksA
MDTTIFKERLQTELATITEELKDLGIQNPEVAQDWIATPQDGDLFEADENVAADRAEDLEERTATIVALEVTYNNLVRALSKIELGAYGNCEICAAPIEEERLEADPSARTCMSHLANEQDLLA